MSQRSSVHASPDAGAVTPSHRVIARACPMGPSPREPPPWHRKAPSLHPTWIRDRETPLPSCPRRGIREQPTTPSTVGWSKTWTRRRRRSDRPASARRPSGPASGRWWDDAVSAPGGRIQRPVRRHPYGPGHRTTGLVEHDLPGLRVQWRRARYSGADAGAGRRAGCRNAVRALARLLELTGDARHDGLWTRERRPGADRDGGWQRNRR